MKGGKEEERSIKKGCVFMEGARTSWGTVQIPGRNPPTLMHFKDSFYKLALRLLLHAIIFSVSGGGGSGDFHSGDRQALLSFKQALQVPKGQLDNWKGEECSQWKGVGCDSQSGRVTKLDLGSMRLAGSIPDKICSLTMLQTLDLRENNISGVIPDCIGELSSLRTLSLYGNQIAGSIPASLGNLSLLLTLNLQQNQLTGTIPAALSALGNLEKLSLAGNRNLGGDIPGWIVWRA